jgi:hypothetical protein
VSGVAKSIKKLDRIKDTKVTNQKKKTLNNGTTVHYATIKRNKPVPAAK